MSAVDPPDPCALATTIARPLEFVRTSLGFQPEPQQLPVFDPAIQRGILCCNRQWGKSTTLAALAVYRAWCFSPALILVVAPTVRQSYELILKIRGFLRELGVRPRHDGFNRVSLQLGNGSRIVAVPADPDTIRGYSKVSMLLVDEAARVPDEVFRSVTPALARSRGSVWLMSTPKGRKGFFHDIWHDGNPEWTRIHSTVADCERIPESFLASERASKPAADFDEDYYCVFQDAHDQYFTADDIDAAISSEVHPLRLDQSRFAVSTGLHYYIGVDLGKFRDHTAFAVIEHRVSQTDLRYANSMQWVTDTTREVRHLERIALRTPYDQVVRRLTALATREPLPSRSTVVVDGTGPGAPVVDLIRRASLPANLISVSITAGETANFANGLNHVPKHHLITNLQLLFQNKRLKIAAGLSDTPALRQELLEMRASSSHHGDLAMALALAAWQQSKERRP